MRQVYAHQAVLVPLHAPALDGLDVITRVDGDRLRILFATSPDQVDEFRARIDAALAAGEWELISSGCARVDAGERPDARRLLRAKNVAPRR
jgi:hypothetical protein